MREKGLYPDIHCLGKGCKLIVNTSIFSASLSWQVSQHPEWQFPTLLHLSQCSSTVSISSRSAPLTQFRDSVEDWFQVGTAVWVRTNLTLLTLCWSFMSHLLPLKSPCSRAALKPRLLNRLYKSFLTSSSWIRHCPRHVTLLLTWHITWCVMWSHHVVLLHCEQRLWHVPAVPNHPHWDSLSNRAQFELLLPLPNPVSIKWSQSLTVQSYTPCLHQRR